MAKSKAAEVTVKGPVEINQRLITAYEAAQEIKAEAEKKLKEAKEALIEALDGAEMGTLKDGRFVTYLWNHRDEHVVKATKWQQLRIVKELPDSK